MRLMVDEPTRLVFRAPTGILRAALCALGVPLSALGVYVMMQVAHSMMSEPGRLNMARTLAGGAVIAAGAFFFAAGFCLACVRKEILIDKARMSVTRSWNALLPISSVNYGLRKFNSVTIECIPGENESTRIYRVSLSGEKAQRFNLFSSAHEADAVSRANGVAQFIGLPCVRS